MQHYFLLIIEERKTIMNSASTLVCTSETHRIEAFYNALKSVGDMNVKSVRGDSWFDDLYSSEYTSSEEIQVDQGWMDDLDEAD
jgi:hypothetical protein